MYLYLNSYRVDFFLAGGPKATYALDVQVLLPSQWRLRSSLISILEMCDANLKCSFCSRVWAAVAEEPGYLQHPVIDISWEILYPKVFTIFNLFPGFVDITGPLVHLQGPPESILMTSTVFSNVLCSYRQQQASILLFNLYSVCDNLLNGRCVSLPVHYWCSGGSNPRWTIGFLAFPFFSAKYGIIFVMQFCQ